MNNARRPPNQAAKWLPAVAAAGLLGTVVVAGVALGGSGGNGAPTTDVVAVESGLTVPDTIPPLTVPDSVPEVLGSVETIEPIVKSQLSRTLVKGLAGDDVEQLQQRLTDLGFVPGPVDGIFGAQTRTAVWAYEKLVLKEPSNAPNGEVTAEMWDELQEPFVIQPRRPNATPNHTEIYLPEQVIAVFHDDKPAMISHMSSGSNETWCEEVTISPGEYGNREGEDPLVRGECGISNTPGGVYTVYRQVDGIRQSALGGMANPVYFNYGIAIHGAQNVPLQGASHGCVRVPNIISKDLQNLIENGDQVFVWDGEKEPEASGSPPPTFNWLDPDYVSTSTTTVPETTSTVAESVPESSTPDSTTPPNTSGATTTTTTTTVPESTTTTTTTTTTTIADGGSTDGGSTDGDGTDGGSTDGGDTDGGGTDGGSSDGGDTGGGDTGGADDGGDDDTGGA